MKVIMPWNNLGCLALSIGGFYFDLYTRPIYGVRGVCFFLSFGRWKAWGRVFPIPLINRIEDWRGDEGPRVWRRGQGWRG